MLKDTHDLKKKKKNIPRIIKIPPNVSNNRNFRLIDKLLVQGPTNCCFTTLYRSGYIYVDNQTPIIEISISQMFDTSVILDGLEAPPPSVKLIGTNDPIKPIPSKKINLDWMYEIPA